MQADSGASAGPERPGFRGRAGFLGSPRKKPEKGDGQGLSVTAVTEIYLKFVENTVQLVGRLRFTNSAVGQKEKQKSSLGQEIMGKRS